MTLCAYCGHPTSVSDGLCPHHALYGEADWAVSNRVMCDFIHRGVVSAAPSELDESSVDLLVDSLETALTQ